MSSKKQAKAEDNHRSQAPAQSVHPTSTSKAQLGRRAQQKINTNSDSHDNKSNTAKELASSNTGQTTCSTLEQFSAKAQEIKQDIYYALEKQSQLPQIQDEPVEIMQLRKDILELSDVGEIVDNTVSSEEEHKKCSRSSSKDKSIHIEKTEHKSNAYHDKALISKVIDCDQSDLSGDKLTDLPVKTALKGEIGPVESIENTSSVANQATKQADPMGTEMKISKKNSDASQSFNVKLGGDPGMASFEPLSAKLDHETKYLSLVSSLRKDFEGSPAMLEPICKKLVQMSDVISKLQSDCENYDSEIRKLLLIKQKLENLCRELQKSNNAIRIESLDLIKLEQSKAKEQTTKIQSTLSGVIKLFDENQQRNMNLRQENQELQTKLRSLLEHCDNWEKGFAAALRQRDIENRLLKTELAKSNLLKNEDKERYLKEKQDLLQLLSMMQEHQSRIEGQEAKLRSDLSNYASKYDECQAVISKGMSKFQTESKRMLKQIEKSKQDYKSLLTKYESSNRRMAQLLDEKQRWDKSMNSANKKIETLEKLCRALREQSSDSRGPNLKGRSGSKIDNDEKISQSVSKQQLPAYATKKNAPVAQVDGSSIDDTSSHVDANGQSGLQGKTIT